MFPSLQQVTKRSVLLKLSQAAVVQYLMAHLVSETLTSHCSDSGFNPEDFMKDSGWSRITSKFLWFSPANHHATTAPDSPITALRCAIALTSQHIITSSDFKLGTSCLTQHLIGYRISKLFITQHTKLQSIRGSSSLKAPSARPHQHLMPKSTTSISLINY
jgi:hypothetical protein